MDDLISIECLRRCLRKFEENKKCNSKIYSKKATKKITLGIANWNKKKVRWRHSLYLHTHTNTLAKIYIGI